MNFNKCLKTQLYKMLISPVPVICAIMIFGLCCITNVYTDADGGKGYSVLTILLLRDPTEAVEGILSFVKISQCSYEQLADNVFACCMRSAVC